LAGAREDAMRERGGLLLMTASIPQIKRSRRRGTEGGTRLYLTRKRTSSPSYSTDQIRGGNGWAVVVLDAETLPNLKKGGEQKGRILCKTSSQLHTERKKGGGGGRRL